MTKLSKSTHLASRAAEKGGAQPEHSPFFAPWDCQAEHPTVALRNHDIHIPVSRVGSNSRSIRAGSSFRLEPGSHTTATPSSPPLDLHWHAEATDAATAFRHQDLRYARYPLLHLVACIVDSSPHGCPSSCLVAQHLLVSAEDARKAWSKFSGEQHRRRRC